MEFNWDNPDWESLWLEVAKAYGTPENECTDVQKEVHRTGLCWATTEITNDYRLKTRMNDFLSWFAGQIYWWPNNEEHHHDRCVAACLFAAMGPDFGKLWDYYWKEVMHVGD